MDPDIRGLSIDYDHCSFVSPSPALDGLIVDTEAAITNRMGERDDIPVSIDIPMTPPQMRTLAGWLCAMAGVQERKSR
jgi:hypothetical protein